MVGYKNRGSFKKGHRPWNKDKNGVYSVDLLRKMSEYAQSGVTGMSGKHHSEGTKKKMGDAKRGKRLSDTHRKKLSLAHVKRRTIPPRWWEDKELVNLTVKKVIRSGGKSPNKAEALLNRILKTNFPREWKFVGDGKVIIEGKCPDFININGRKLIIELFGKYWHDDSEVEPRKRLFAKYGYKTLILWDYEIKNEDYVVKTILTTFNGRIC